MKPKQAAAAEEEVTNPLHGQFDAMIDAVLGSSAGETVTSPDKIKPRVESWAIPLKDIYGNSGIRLDASHYDQQTTLALDELKQSGFSLQPLSEVADLKLPGQFVRIWAKDSEYGVQYVNATDLMSITALGTLDGKTRFLSRVTNVDIGELTLRAGWLVMTCSGTIGRIFHIPKSLDGCAGTHDLVRIIPKTVPIGYLHAYLSSPLAQTQILGHTHGGQIDHVTDDQVGTVLVPILSDAEMKDIHKRTLAALDAREKAMQSLAETANSLRTALHK